MLLQRHGNLVTDGTEIVERDERCKICGGGRDDMAELWECPECNLKFRSYHGLQLHYNEVHSKED